MLVDSGLQAGEQVVIDGQEKLRNGSPVMPSHWNQAAQRPKKSSAAGHYGTANLRHPPAMHRASDTSKHHHHHDAGAGAAAGQTP